MKDIDILENAFTNLQNKLGDKLKWTPKTLQKRDVAYDAIFILNGIDIYVEAKNEVRPNQIEQLVEQKNELGNLLLVANYITPNSKEILKEKNINYIDRHGNMYFKYEAIHIYIEKIANKVPIKNQTNRAFAKAGIKVIFQILLDTDLINTTYRNMAEKAGVALGTIPKVIEGLKEEGLILRRNKKQWMLSNYEELLSRWHQEYVKRLRPTLFVKRYRTSDTNFNLHWKETKLKDGAVWGGEPAADILSNYLKPELYTLYTNQTQQDIMKAYRWIPDEQGEIIVYKKFWKPLLEEENFAPSLLVYAELIESKDSRCIETANLIYEQFQQKS